LLRLSFELLLLLLVEEEDDMSMLLPIVTSAELLALLALLELLELFEPRLLNMAVRRDACAACTAA